MAKPTGAVLWAVLNAEPWAESLPKDVAHLPAVSAASVAAAHPGARDVHDLSADDVRTLGSTWAKRLAASHGGVPRFVAFNLDL
jgi:hypothetical protein